MSDLDPIAVSYDWTLEKELNSLSTITAKQPGLATKLAIIGGLFAACTAVLIWIHLRQYGDLLLALRHFITSVPGFAVLLGFCLIILILYLTRPPVQAKMLRKRVESSVPHALLGTRITTLSRDGMAIETPASNGIIAWSAISKIERNNGFILFLSGDMYRFGAIAEDDVDDVEAYLKHANALRKAALAEAAAEVKA